MWDDENFNNLIDRDDVKTAIGRSKQLQSLLRTATGKSPMFIDPDFPANEQEDMKQQARRTFVSELRVMGIEPF